MDNNDINNIKALVGEFFDKMTIPATKIDVRISTEEDLFLDQKDALNEKKDSVLINVFLEEPQILIGQGGQTLFETQRVLKMVLNKKLQKNFYLDLDINDYKKQKIEYLKSLAKDLADHVALTKETKTLFPMPAYERRIIHKELSHRSDIISESQGEGLD